MMKNTQLHETSNSCLEESETLLNEKLKIFDSFGLKCKCGQQVSFLCAQESCNKDAAICNLCEKRHSNSKCFDAKFAKTIYTSIDNKITELDSEVRSTLEQLQQKVDKIGDNLFEMTKLIKNQMKLLGLEQSDRELAYVLLKRLKQFTHKDKEIIEVLEQSDDLKHRNSNFTGETINQIFAHKNRFNDSFSQSIKRFKSILQKSKRITLSYFDQIEDQILNLIIKKEKKLKMELGKYYSNSKILNNNYQQSSDAFFRNFDNLLFKGGINGLPVKKIFTYTKSLESKKNNLGGRFAEEIQGKSDLLFLIQNNYQKRFGFFSPLQFNSQKSGWIKDENQKALIFSLDINRSELITNPQYSLKYDCKNRKISVGGINEKYKDINQKKRNGIQITMGQVPICEIIMEEENTIKPISVSLFSSGSNGLFGNTQPQQNPFTSAFKELNGNQKSVFSPLNIQLSKLQIYQVYRPTKKEELKII